jgi:2-aminoethylphosphonate-pyruvate transaminase
MADIARVLGIPFETIIFEEAAPVSPERLRAALAKNSTITHVGTIHCETSTGILNPIAELGHTVNEFSRVFVVDAMSSFGGIPISIAENHIDFLVSSANKCIQGVPGFAFVLARRDLLQAAEACARSVSLDLVAQWKGLESDGQFRFTPPTHALLAFWQALQELEEEGGIEARASRYAANQQELMRGMTDLGLDAYLAPEHQSHIISSFRCPGDQHFDFSAFYHRLSELGFLIYPGKVSNTDCFRVGTIGHLFPKDMKDLVAAVQHVLREMKIESAHAITYA